MVSEPAESGERGTNRIYHFLNGVIWSPPKSELWGVTNRIVNVSHGPRETLFTLTFPPPPPSATTYHDVSFARSVIDSP
jgi:hypothetical protein